MTSAPSLPDMPIQDRWFESAWQSYTPTVMALAKGKRVLEVGAGRRPLFTPEELAANAIAYTANDIDQGELDRIPFDVAKACFDVAGGVPDGFKGKFDLIFSQFVQEHVHDGKKYYANLHALLAPGGVALNFHPTLYHPVFIANLMLPEALSAKVLRTLFPNRNHDENPKFPAYYKLCTSMPGTAETIRALGFASVEILPFYGHLYLQKVPLLNRMSAAFDRWLMRRNIRRFSTYAYTLAVK
jgi:SAM-dependent methyltransferase